MRKNKRYSRNEFRYNYVTKHPNYIFEEDGSDYHSLGITHQKRTKIKNKWRKNTPLHKNPQNKKTKKSYLRYGYITQNKNTYGNIDAGFNFDELDISKVRTKVHSFKNFRRKK